MYCSLACGAFYYLFLVKKIWMFLATEITYNLDEGTSTSKFKMAFMNDVRGGRVSNKQKNQYFRERWRKTSSTIL